MVRPVSEAFKERNQEIIQEYQSGVPIGDLGLKYGMSTRWLRALMNNAGVGTLPSTTQNDRAFNQRTVAMGAKLHHHRMKRGLSTSEFSVLIGLSEKKFCDAIVGRHAWTILEMERAAKEIGLSLEDFIAPPKGV